MIQNLLNNVINTNTYFATNDLSATISVSSLIAIIAGTILITSAIGLLVIYKEDIEYYFQTKKNK